MKIAVTGGIGSVVNAVVDMALVQGHRVVCIDRAIPSNDARKSDVAYIQADVTDYTAVENAFRGCDAVVHMAAIPAPGSLPGS